jgi:methylmalonyl-CoA/ethylmalonyl-CoA epimerase
MTGKELENNPGGALGTTTVVQIGMVVKDIARSTQRYADLFGLPKPEIIVTDEYEKARTAFEGQPTKAQAKLAFFRMGQVSLELIEPIGRPSTWGRFLDEKGEGVHHIAFNVVGTDQVVKALDAVGIRVEQQGYYTGGMYTYVDTMPQLGVILELLENLGAQERGQKAEA